MFQCLNCGFKFRYPAYKTKPLPIGGTWVIDPRALNIPACPKCGSDAIEKIEEYNEEEW